MKQWREDRGLTQADVARSCGVTGNTIARCERGVHIPRPTLLRKLIELTGLTADEILTSAIRPQPQQKPGRPRLKRRDHTHDT